MTVRLLVLPRGVGPDGPREVAICSNFSVFAQEVVGEGEVVVGEPLPPVAKRHLISVVCKWLKPDERQFDGMSLPLATLVRSESATDVQIAGELGLLLASWFPQRAHRRHVNVPVTYFADIAATAYMRLSMSSDEWTAVAQNVGLMVAILSVSGWNDVDPMSAYERIPLHPYFVRAFRASVSKGSVLSYDMGVAALARAS